MNSARVRDFHALLIGHLTQYDRAEERRELKRGGRTNIYRLGHLLKAAEKVEKAAKDFGIWDRDDPAALKAYHNFLTQNFIYESRTRGGPDRFVISNLNKLDKQIQAWVEHGKLPKYPSMKNNPGDLALVENPGEGVALLAALAVAGGLYLWSKRKKEDKKLCVTAPYTKLGEFAKALGYKILLVETKAVPEMPPATTEEKTYVVQKCSFFAWTGTAWVVDSNTNAEFGAWLEGSK